MINMNETIEKISNNYINSKLENFNSLSRINPYYENLNKQIEEEYSKKANFPLPKNIKDNANTISDQSIKNLSHNYELQSKLDNFQHVAKLTKRKIAPIETKNGYMNKTNKANDFMKYINKTLYQDNNKIMNENTLNNKNHLNNKEKISTIKSMSDLKNHLDLLNLNTPKNIKKTLNSIAIKNSSNRNSYNHYTTNNSPSNQNNFSNFNNTFSNANSTSQAEIAHSQIQSLNENTFKNFINSNNNQNSFPYPRLCVNTNQFNSNNIANYQKQTTKFLFDVSNFTKYSKTESAKFATKPAGILSSFGVNTNFGNVRYKLNFYIRDYNEDRVSILLNILNPNAEPNVKWPQISFFGIYDGHAGNSCADFLKENLHQFVKHLINFFIRFSKKNVY
jgi:hypothetical protein